MKKMNLFVAAAVVALGSVLTSCSSTDNALPTVTFAAGTGATINAAKDTITLPIGTTTTKFTYTVAAEAEIKTLTEGIGSSLKAASAATGETAYGPIEVTLTGLTDGSLTTYNVKVVDKDANEVTGSVVVKVNKAAATALSSATTFTLTYKSNTQTDGANENALTGIKYSKNTGSTGAFLANIEVTSTSNNIVVLSDKAAYDAITTKEALVAAYTAGTKVTSFTAATETAFAKKYIITKTNDVYYLISLDSITLASANNQAVFSYKK